MPNPSIHACALLIGAKAVLILGASGAGKSRLCYHLLQNVLHTRLVGDDRVHLEAHHGRLIVRPAPQLQGLLELRGVGLLTFPFEPQAQVSHVVELLPQTPRLPEPSTRTFENITLPFMALQSGENAAHNLIAFLDASSKNL
jgi:serine kinase of HPr protein (carbohydrate metabolism regulator)